MRMVQKQWKGLGNSDPFPAFFLTQSKSELVCLEYNKTLNCRTYVIFMVVSMYHDRIQRI